MTLVVPFGVPLLIIFLFLYLRGSPNSKRLPAGPRGIPLLGNTLQLIKNPHLKLSQWAMEYGKLYTIKIGRMDTLVVSDAKLMKGIFGHQASTGKLKTELLLKISGGPYGILHTEGTLWIEQRQFFTRTLVQHGLGNKASMEPLILSEIQEVVNTWKGESHTNLPVSVHDTLELAIGNVLWTFVTSGRAGLRGQQVSKLAGYLERAIHFSAKSGVMFLPWLKYIAPKLTGYDELIRSATEFHMFIEGIYDEHRKTQTLGTPRNIIDSYLEQLDMHKDNPT